MSNHPLDISGILKSKPPQPSNEGQEALSAVSDNESANKSSSPEETRIEGRFWSQLNQESRRMLTSRIWKGVDFNPMLAELDDLSRITEKWLKWAVPTYVNGVKAGPIKDWMEGLNRDKDFHYVLVGEHLRHLKELREKRKTDQASSPNDAPALEEKNQETPIAPQVQTEGERQVNSTPEQDQELQTSIETLDGHIRWFKQYLQERET